MIKNNIDLFDTNYNKIISIMKIIYNSDFSVDIVSNFNKDIKCNSLTK